jgi:hypothetical protein
MQGRTLASTEWYETPARCVVGSCYADEIASLLPATGWRTQRREIWLDVSHVERSIPTQGFKIHVSSTPACALEVLRVVASECIAREISFKCTAGPELLSFQNSKVRVRGGGGKFITLYPSDINAFSQMLQALYVRTAGRPLVGPYILSDRRYRDSKILFYRYGGMNATWRLQPDGTRLYTLVAPNGEEIEDRREAFFVLPPWVRDPFDRNDSATEEDGSTIVGQYFQVEAMISASNRGGVYEAIDLRNGETIVLKESRPHVTPIGIDGTHIDPHSLLRHEYDVLKHLDGLPWVPRPILLFQDWEHLFLAQQKMKGVMLGALLPREENQWLSRVRSERGWERFLPKFAQLANSLLDALEAVHNRGVIFGDLSMNNIIVDVETWQVKLIDLEAAIRVGQDEHLMGTFCGWLTPGYARPGRVRSGVLDYKDDYYALSRVLRGSLLPSAGLSELNPKCHEAFIQFLRELGLPEWPLNVVLATANGDFAGAREALSEAQASAF